MPLSHRDYGGTSGNQIYDLMYTYSADPWTFGPYVQYQSINNSGGSEWGIGVLGSYQFNPQWSLNARFEYEDSSVPARRSSTGRRARRFRSP